MNTIESFCELIKCSAKEICKLKRREDGFVCIDRKHTAFFKIGYTCRYIDFNGRPHGEFVAHSGFVAENEAPPRPGIFTEASKRTRLQIISALAKSGCMKEWQTSAK